MSVEKFVDENKGYLQELLLCLSIIGNLDAIQLIVEKGISIDIETLNCSLRYGAHHGYLEIVKFFTEIGADRHSCNDHPLKISAIKGDIST